MKEIYATAEGVFFDGVKIATINEDVLPTVFFAFCDELEKIEITEHLQKSFIRLKDALVDPQELDGVIGDVKDLAAIKTVKERTSFAEQVVERIERIQDDMSYTLEMS